MNEWMNEFIYSNNKKQLRSTVHIMDYKLLKKG